MLHSRGIWQAVDGEDLWTAWEKTNSPTEWMDGKLNTHNNVLLQSCRIVYEEWNKTYLMKLFCDYYLI